MKTFLIILALSISACSVVGPGERGVRFYMGKASDTVADPGAYFWVPFFFGMKEIDVQVQKSDIEASAASKDMQEIKTEVAVNWKLAPERVITTYKNVGDEYDILTRIIRPAVSEVLKSTTSQFTAEDILKKRMELKKLIDDGLKERLNAYGIDLADVNIVHLAFSEDFEKAIEAKQVAEQEAQKAVYLKQKATQEGLAAVELAKGQKVAQDLIRTSITHEILQQRAIEKWDGHFPQFMGGGALPFINLQTNEMKANFR